MDAENTCYGRRNYRSYLDFKGATNIQGAYSMIDIHDQKTEVDYMKYVHILVAVGIMLFSSIATANTENINGNGIGTNGIISINIDKNYPLFYNVNSAQITIVRVENNIEKVVWENTRDMPFTLSFSVAPGTYKIYVQKDESTVLEFNDDSTGYLVTPKSKINIGSDTINAVPTYINGISTDVFSDLPWRINAGENIPITYVVKDTDQWSLYIRDIFIYNEIGRASCRE